jgi:ABC-2 type transport system ATP-binding protein
MKGSGKALEVSKIAKTYAAVRAVDDISFDVQSGEIFGLLGPNGAGKTTTIRMILDIIRPDHGVIKIFGGPIDDAKKDRIGYLPEERGLYEDMTLLDTLLFLGQLKGLSHRVARQRAEVYLREGRPLGSPRAKNIGPQPGDEPEGPVYRRHFTQPRSADY